MRGQQCTLKDIVLQLQPEVVDLYCHEQFASSDEEDNRVDGEQPTEPAQQAYRVVSYCGRCCRAVRLVVESDEADIRALQQLLLGTLTIVCPICV
uniref:Protein E7 n=1 Tax=human papillomavirus 71 TaxID=120686 RepID=Q6EGQ8_9PAPI|nr:putative transforming protein E7 [human papillomavirus 71]AAQ95185.1 putative transforming protein E7 [human papillomavirus 71]AAQ95199.1 putative transforming protein E7 [human papillomavirus 71]QIT07802.1 early protein E7 [human papillomavirus 71]